MSSYFKPAKVYVQYLCRPGCAPCKTGLFFAERIRTRVPFTLKVIDVTQYKEYQEYKDKVPVFLINGEELPKRNGKIVQKDVLKAIIEAQSPEWRAENSI